MSEKRPSELADLILLSLANTERGQLFTLGAAAISYQVFVAGKQEEKWTGAEAMAAVHELIEGGQIVTKSSSVCEITEQGRAGAQSIAHGVLLINPNPAQTTVYCRKCRKSLQTLDTADMISAAKGSPHLFWEAVDDLVTHHRKKCPLEAPTSWFFESILVSVFVVNR